MYGDTNVNARMLQVDFLTTDQRARKEEEDAQPPQNTLMQNQLMLTAGPGFQQPQQQFMGGQGMGMGGPMGGQPMYGGAGMPGQFGMQ